MKLCFLIKVCLIFLLPSRARSRITTERYVTATWGTSFTLPCRFDGDPIGVYWHKHEATGDLASDNKIVVTNFRGSKIINDTRYDITDDFSMVIKNVTAEDETTFSCEVALVEDNYDGKNYTDVRVIAKAHPLHPIVPDCSDVTQGTCDYTVGHVEEETFPLTCQVTSVRPAVSLAWSALSGSDPPTKETEVKESIIPGLYNVYLTALVSKAKIGKRLICVASGEAVGGSSNITVGISEAQRARGLSGGGLAAVLIVCLLVIPVLLAGIFYYLYKKRISYKQGPIEPQDMEKMITSNEEEEAEIKKLREEILAYKPGKITKVPLAEDRLDLLPKSVNVAIVGETGAGKSSLARSFLYAVTGHFNKEIEVATGKHSGGLTKKPTAYKITDTIHMQDNKGLRDRNVSHVRGIMSRIRTQNIHGAILVSKTSPTVTSIEKTLPGIVREFSDAFKKEFDAYPFIILTHRDEMTDDGEAEIRTLLGAADAYDDRLIFVENFTEDPVVTGEPRPDLVKHFLKTLKDVIIVADKNMVCEINSRDLSERSICTIS